MSDISKAGTYKLGSREVTRLGYGAMQLAGPHVFGPPRDRGEAVAVLREAVESGVNHIDTSDYYGPYVTNEIIREALYPYPEGLVIVTKVGATRGGDGSWDRADSAGDLRRAVEDNLQRLGVDAMEVVNLRIMIDLHPAEGSIAPQAEAMARLQQEGLVSHVGVSNVTTAQVREAQSILPVACVQNQYNLAHRGDDALVDELAAQGIPYVPFFPLGGFSPLQSAALSDVAARLEATPLQVALAWLLRRSPNILLIPGTSRRTHLRENLAAAKVDLDDAAAATLDAIGHTQG